MYCILYIISPGLPITRGRPGLMVPSGSAAPGLGGYKNTPRQPEIRFQRRWRFPRACEWHPGPTAVPPRGGQPAVALHQDQVVATLPRQAGKRRRRSRSGRVVVAHPGSGGNCGWARHGRLRQWWWWPQETRVTPAVARGAIIYSDDSHVRRGWLWHDSMTNSSDQVASVASFDIVASGSSSVDKLSHPCLCHR